MNTYTPEQITAADELAHANGHLRDVLAHEPVDHGQIWDQWNNEYQAAWRDHEGAEQVFRALFKTDAPSAFAVLRATREPVNPLLPTLAPGLWRTRDNRFVIGSYTAGHPKSHLLAVMFWERTIDQDPGTCDPTVRVDVPDLEHAQQVVEQITWADSVGARPAEQSSR